MDSNLREQLNAWPVWIRIRTCTGSRRTDLYPIIYSFIASFWVEIFSDVTKPYNIIPFKKIHKRLEPENVVVFVVIDEEHVQSKIRKGQVPTVVHVQHSLALFDMDNTSTAGIELVRQNLLQFRDVILSSRRAEYERYNRVGAWEQRTFRVFNNASFNRMEPPSLPPILMSFQWWG